MDYAPLRYRDPSGRYSEEQIVTAFEATTWDEVLAFFCTGGALEGLWGWLEILRRAVDGDMVRYGATESTTGEVSIGGLPGNTGFLSRDEAGRIFVGNREHSEFAREGHGFVYSLLKKDSRGVHVLDYQTPSSALHYHPRSVAGSADPRGAWIDFLGMAADTIGAFGLANVELAPWSTGLGGLALGLGFLIDLGPATEGFLDWITYRDTGHLDSGDVLDMTSLIPGIGSVTDVVSIASNLSGLRIVITP